VNDRKEDVMDAKQMAGQCKQMMAGKSEEGGATAGTSRQCGELMAAMCGGRGEGAGMLEHCEQMAARFAGRGEAAEEAEQREPEVSELA
jgi:hypothetical protein